jgi:putative chitinase
MKKNSRVLFFDAVRPSLFKGSIMQKQVEGINVILDKWEAQGLTDLRWLAYMLATAYHETAATMQPIEERGKGRGYKYGRNIKRSGIVYDFSRYPYYYYGRGYVQLTWFENYDTMGRLLGVDLLNNPHLALYPNIAAEIMFEGMTKGDSSFGDFTGKALENYFNDKKEDWIGARRIINGTDCAKMIGEYAKRFYAALKRSVIY